MITQQCAGEVYAFKVQNFSKVVIVAFQFRTWQDEHSGPFCWETKVSMRGCLSALACLMADLWILTPVYGMFVYLWNKYTSSGLQIEGVLAYFTHLKCQKRIGEDVGDFKYIFTK
jgi:hypothetical protein